MKKALVVVMVGVIGVGFLWASSARAEEEKPAQDAKTEAKDAKKAEFKVGDRKLIEGVVTVEKEGDAVKQVCLAAGDAKITVFSLAGEGKKLVDMEGKKVRAIGRIADVGGKLVLQVAMFEELKQ